MAGKGLSKKTTKELHSNSVTPNFYDADGKPLSEHKSFNEALQSGEDSSRNARLASGTKDEYGVATILGRILNDGTQTYYNSAPVTSNSPEGELIQIKCNPREK